MNPRAERPRARDIGLAFDGRTGPHNAMGYFISPIVITNTFSVGMAHHATAGWMIDQYKDFFVNDHGRLMEIMKQYNRL